MMTCRPAVKFLRSYKQNVKRFRSVYVPRPLSYALCYLWEKYSDYSKGQLPPAFNRRPLVCDVAENPLQQSST